MKIIALLPMKGNSERVPNKNLKDFAGKPLYHRVMNVLLSSKYIDKVIVNTDSKIIKEDLSKHFLEDVIIIDRPQNIVGDMVSMNKIIECDINSVKADFYLQTHSTNPLLTSASIDNAVEKMFSLNKEGIYDSIFSVTKLQTRLYTKTGEPFNHNPHELLRTQDLEPLYEENSNFYIFTKDSFDKSGGKRIGNAPFMFEIDKIEAVDIDEPQDFIIAEAIFKLLS
ncbi:acylneuraminate cytidylyltransferase family protein [Polaribacter glomeratus]|uniref:Acylneuraminate cytidylyltransferase n=1 Tax=Polaribacter glomeratus TaxID=102 RepID=A0A2S7WU14_9FLAO|nr:acylneuraminate cytidylyltransferase family protein [Polaribacter glomeratus]PQJ81090.1 acylneuraminate cytidylyltransferase [Polaribacter glomeratus]TXD65642.1 acylneuraminate cytidylyltransferase family protein [Polaribacter glomeratus]